MKINRSELSPIVDARFGAKCSYCEGPMNIELVRFKRRVPRGVKDLGLYDERYCFKCPRDNNTQELSSSVIQRCSCGTEAVAKYYATAAPNWPVMLPTWFGSSMVNDDNENWSREKQEFTSGPERCTNCLNCAICKLPLKSQKVFSLSFDCICGEHPWEEKWSRGNHYYVHQQCAARSSDLVFSLEQDWRQQYYIPTPLDEERKQAEWEARLLQSRLSRGLCISCGTLLDLNLFDKVRGTKQCRKCR